MTVQQDQPTTVLAVAPMPTPRYAEHDAVPPAVVRRTGDWAAREELIICRWMMAGMLALGVFAAFMVWLGARVL